MSNYVMEGRDHAARRESEFVLGFIEAMFFTECSPVYDSKEWFTEECQSAIAEGHADGSLPCDVGYTDLHSDSLEAIREFCIVKQAAMQNLLTLAYGRNGYNERQAGSDLWFTVNGHGVGYWSRKELESDSNEWQDLQRPLDTWTPADSILFDKLKSESLGDLLSNVCGRSEINPFFGNHIDYGNAPFVYVDLLTESGSLNHD